MTSRVVLLSEMHNMITSNFLSEIFTKNNLGFCESEFLSVEVVETQLRASVKWVHRARLKPSLVLKHRLYVSVAGWTRNRRKRCKVEIGYKSVFSAQTHIAGHLKIALKAPPLKAQSTTSKEPSRNKGGMTQERPLGICPHIA